jgi:PPK2 family polyphosphate:nucleotide phosphotransferase
LEKINPYDFRYDGSKEFKIKELYTKIPEIYKDKNDYKKILEGNAEELDELQSLMYAHDRYGLLVIFQAMDGAGKDGTLKRVFAGVNPIGVKVHSFKRPSENELEHDFMWRTTLLLPQRGTITVFNRSYYEEVLVVKVHPAIVTNVQRLPHELTDNMYNLWEQRYQDIRNSENYLFNNGIRVVKFFLNVSKKEQAERLIARIDDPAKNWKFEEGDVKEREFWDDYQQAYQEAINATATETAPWYVIPADDKNNMRLIVGQIIAAELKKMDMKYPESDEKRHEELRRFIKIIKEQNGN